MSLNHLLIFSEVTTNSLTIFRCKKFNSSQSDSPFLKFLILCHSGLIRPRSRTIDHTVATWVSWPLIPTENEYVLVFQKSKWIRKQKLTKRAVVLFCDVSHTSWISHFKAESIGYLNNLTQKSLQLTKYLRKCFWTFATWFLHAKYT